MQNYWQEMREYCKWQAEEREKETIMSCHEHIMTKEEVNKSSHVHVMSWKELDKTSYVKLLTQLEMWGVYAPKALVKKYGAQKCYNAMEMTLHVKPRIPHAYFRKIVTA